MRLRRGLEPDVSLATHSGLWLADQRDLPLCILFFPGSFAAIPAISSFRERTMSALAVRFSSFTRVDKAIFLARVAHEATIYARMSYVPTPAHPERDYDHPDPIILRDANNFVHRVVGYIQHILKGTEWWKQDEIVIEMIEHQFREGGSSNGSPTLEGSKLETGNSKPKWGVQHDNHLGSHHLEHRPSGRSAAADVRYTVRLCPRVEFAGQLGRQSCNVGGIRSWRSSDTQRDTRQGDAELRMPENRGGNSWLRLSQLARTPTNVVRLGASAASLP
jgi:hypothetical protein